MDYRELLCECYLDPDFQIFFLLVTCSYGTPERTYSMLVRLVHRIPFSTSLKAFNEILTHPGRLS